MPQKKQTFWPFIFLFISGLLIVVGLWLVFKVAREGSGQFFSGSSKSKYELSTIYKEPERFSYGDRDLFTLTANAYTTRGIAAFQQGKYPEAVNLFQKAVQEDINNPELQIYLNNARSRLGRSPFTIAAVVPVDNTLLEDVAQEILRGVAQAQTSFNEAGGIDNHLLQIVLAKDSSTPEKAASLAQQIAENPNILGVIGHLSFTSIKVALKEYEKAGLALISPTNPSTALTGSVFFRTTYSNKVLMKKLAEYTKTTLGFDKVVSFYVPGETLSNGNEQFFESYFQKLGGTTLRSDMSEPNFDPNIAVAKSISDDRVSVGLLFPGGSYFLMPISVAKANYKLPVEKRLRFLGSTEIYNTSTLKLGKEAINGLTLVVPWFADAEKSKNFAEAASKRWGGPVNYRTAFSFDATQAFIKALSNKPSRATVLQNLKNINLPASETSGEPLQFSQGERVEVGEAIIVQVVKTRKSQFQYGFEIVDSKSKDNS